MNRLSIVLVLFLGLLAACTDDSAWRNDPTVVAAREACKSGSGVDYDCIEGQAVTALNPEICRLAGIGIDDMCLQAVYEAADDPSICDRIYLRGVVPNCRAYYGSPSPSQDLSAFYGNRPPAALLIVGDQEQVAAVGTSTWTLEKKGQEQTSVHGDAFALVTPAEPLPVPASFTAILRLPIPTMPSTLWYALKPVTDSINRTTDVGETTRWQVAFGQPGTSLDLKPEQEIPLSLDPGEYLLEVYAEWPELGSADYGFFLEVQAKENEEQTHLTPVDSTNIPLEQPLKIATMLILDSWSPDSRYLAYWTFDAVQNPDDSYPPGNLVFREVLSGRECIFAYPTIYGTTEGGQVFWQMDGTVAVLRSKPPMVGHPCGDDFQEIPDDKIDTYRLESIDQAISPDGNFRVTTQYVDIDRSLVVTDIINSETNKKTQSVQWQRMGLGGLSLGGNWISVDKFLIYFSVDQGPLIIDTKKGIIPVVSSYFGLPRTPCGAGNCDQYWRAAGVPDDGLNQFHIILAGTGEEANLPHLRLYHSEDKQIEEMPYQYYASSSPNGQLFILYTYGENTAKNWWSYKFWLRPFDPVGTQLRQLLETEINPLPLTWSPDSSRVAIRSSDRVMISSTQDGTSLGQLLTDSEPLGLLWSPDGRLLAIQGLRYDGSDQSALFVFDISTLTAIEP